ncbi:MAG: SbcC/MukB-like Walker B domain-containing protein, partial [Planctomycetota bacterium]
IQHLEDAQTLEATPLDRIRQIELPRIEASISTAGSQLEFTIAAVSDHAKRLRESLQDNHECPVCGSTSHPYREHAPEEDVVAIKAARKFVRELEKQRDDLMKQEARLQSSIAVRASQLDDLKAEQLTAQTQLAAASFDATPDPAVQEILMLPEEAQLAACEERLLRLNSVELRSLAQREQKARDSSQTVRQTQSQKDQIERQVADIEQRLSLLSSDLQKIQMKLELAGMTLQKATESQTLADEVLTDVWKCLPTSRAEFQQDANEFRRRFDQAMQEFVSIDRRLKEEQNRLEQATTEIRWLSDAAGKAETKLDSAAASLRLATEQCDDVHTERQLLFSGRSADDVEQKMENDLKSAQMEYENSAALLNELERQIAAAESELRRETEFLEQSRQNSSEAGSRRSAWVEAFSEHHGTTLTDEDFNHMLSRDSAWIDSERAILKQLDNAVAVSRGEVLVRSELLREHVGSHSPDRPEAEILAELAETQRAINLAKHDESEALGVLQIDDHRRRNNAQLLDKIRRQDAISDPWRKLNDLIGSADGSKFRMMAQRTTLDVLLSYANLQLSQFASRYALERIPESLNLIIMDRDMGDERRSVHSLSGGESFLVSLALALGLASLTSNRLRIESLFIDEGFGSLDPQTLNTAMSALMQLESQGRKVGVISHVTEMTDAIPVQIQVIRGRRGASRIVVPGCSRTDTDSQETSVASSRVPDAELATETGRSPGLIREISQQIIAILERESIAGKSKVSTKSIRQELQCDSATWQQAQMMIKDRITTEGRSLVLRSDVEKQP